jgi:hypothetical protein
MPATSFNSFDRLRRLPGRRWSSGNGPKIARSSTDLPLSSQDHGRGCWIRECRAAIDDSTIKCFFIFSMLQMLVFFFYKRRMILFAKNTPKMLQDFSERLLRVGHIMFGASDESLDRLLFSCPSTRFIWSSFRCPFNMHIQVFNLLKWLSWVVG